MLLLLKMISPVVLEEIDYINLLSC